MNQSERRRAIENQHLSTRSSVTIPILASIFGVADNTIKSDLLFLETQGVALCENPDGKPQRWFAASPKGDLGMSLEMACAIKRVKEAAKVLLPEALFHEVECFFNAANDAYLSKQKANHQSKVIRYERSVSNVDFIKHLHLGQINSDVLEEVKSAIYKGNMLRLEIDGCEEVLSEISLIEFDGKLLLEGRAFGSRGKPLRFNTRNITGAWELELPPLRPVRNRAA